MPEVFVDRGVELVALQRFRDEVILGHGGVMVLQGDGGIGKSALIRAFLDVAEAEKPELCLVSTRCRSDIGPGDAYGPIIRALAALYRPASRRRMGRASKAVAAATPDLLALVPAIGPVLKIAGEAALAAINKGNAVSDSMAQFQYSVARSVSERVRDAGRDSRPVIIVIDDAQQIDPSSLLVLDYLVDDLADRHLGIILAARNEEPAESVPLGRVVRSWMSRGVLQRLPLGGLDASSIEELAIAALGASASAVDAVSLERLTGGNLLCLTQYLHFVGETGSTETGSRVLLDRSASIRDAVIAITGERLALLDDMTRRLLVIGATEGETFHTSVVEQVSGLPGEDVRDRLHAASVNTRLILGQDGLPWFPAISSDTYRFEHGLLQAAMHADQSPATARDRHAKIAELLVKLVQENGGAAPSAVLLDVARHYRGAGLYRQAAERSIRAARDLVANRFSLAEAAGLAHAAIDDLHLVSITAPDHDRLLAEAIELYLVLTELNWSRTAGAEEGFDLDRLAEEAHEAAERVGDPLLMARAVLLRGKVTVHTRSRVESLVFLQQAVDLARSTSDAATIFVALAEYGRQLPKRDLAAGLQVLRDAEALFERTPELQNSADPVVVHARNLTEMQMGVNLFDSGDLGAALERLNACATRLRTAPFNAELPIALNYYAQIMIACGQWDKAATTLEDALALEERGGPSGWRAYNRALLALVTARTADRDVCRRMAEDAWNETEATSLVNLVPIVRNLCAQTLFDLADGDPAWLEDSDRLATETIQETRRTGMVRSEIAGLILRSQIARCRSDHQGAFAFAGQAVAIINAHGHLPALRTEEVLLHAALAHREVGDAAGAAALVARAANEVDRKARSLPPELRRVFLTDVPINVAIASLAAATLPGWAEADGGQLPRWKFGA